MSTEAVESHPAYAQPPPGYARLDHLPTVEAGIHYWEAVRDGAIQSCNPDLERTAEGLRLSYEAARQALMTATSPRSRRCRKSVRLG
jgi:hypothetical protein